MTLRRETIQMKIRGLITLAVFASVLLAQNRGSLAGKVLADDTGKPLAGVMVVTIAGSSIQEGRSSVFRSVTDENGAYFLPGLPPGTYRICVSDAKDYLDPCQWGPETSINVVDTPANLNLRLRKGARLVVRIADPNGLVAGYKKAVEAAASVPGAFTNVTLSDAEGNSKLVPLTHWADNIY